MISVPMINLKELFNVENHIKNCEQKGNSVKRNKNLLEII